MAASGSKKVIIISLLANFSVALSKLFGAFYTKSSSLMSESIHSFSDCCNQLLLLYGTHAAQQDDSDKYPLGRDKEIFFWSFIVAVLLFTMGGVFSLYEGIHKIQDPHPLSHPYVGVIILVMGIVVESYSLLACYNEIKLINKQKSLWQWVKKTHAADLLVIFLENFAAALGLLIALIALLLTWFTGDPTWDALGSCFIGVLLIATAIVLAVELKHMLIGERASTDYEEALATELEALMPGAKFLNLIAVQRGINSVLLAYKVHPGNRDNLQETINGLNQFEAKVKANHPEVKWQFAELDLKN